MISYAGVPLIWPSADLIAAADLMLDPSWLAAPSSVRTFPGKDLVHVGFHGYRPQGPNRIGVLSWPGWGASRFAVGYYLVDETGLTQIRAAVGSQGDQTYTAADLVINDGRQSVTARMWMLPARPLVRADQTIPGLYLLTLVDGRYFWWTQAGGVTVYPGATGWSDVYAQIGTGLGTALAADAVDGAYLYPHKSLYRLYQSLPVLLDAVALSVGQRVVFNLDGTANVYGADSAWGVHTLNLALADKLAGGNLFLSNQTPNDLNAALPYAVVVSWAREDGDEFDDPAKRPSTATTVNLSSLTVPELTGVTVNGFTGEKVFRSSVLYTADLATRQNLANRLALDFYRFSLGRPDVSLEGARNWRPDGLTGVIEWDHRGDVVRTRAVRDPFLDHAEEVLQYYSPAVSSTSGSQSSTSFSGSSGSQGSGGSGSSGSGSSGSQGSGSSGSQGSGSGGGSGGSGSGDGGGTIPCYITVVTNSCFKPASSTSGSGSGSGFITPIGEFTPSVSSGSPIPGWDYWVEYTEFDITNCRVVRRWCVKNPDCCYGGGGGSGDSGSGSTGGVLVPCCPGIELPTSLRLTCISASGDCVDCHGGGGGLIGTTLLLNWNASSTEYNGTLQACGGKHSTVRLHCEATGMTWALEIASVGLGGISGTKSLVSSDSCDPLQIQFNGISTAGCFLGTTTPGGYTGTSSWLLTET